MNITCTFGAALASGVVEGLGVVLVLALAAGIVYAAMRLREGEAW